MWSKKTPFLMAVVVAILALIWGQLAWPKHLQPLTNRLLEYPGNSIPTLRNERGIYRVTHHTPPQSSFISTILDAISPHLPQPVQIAGVRIMSYKEAREWKQERDRKDQENAASIQAQYGGYAGGYVQENGQNIAYNKAAQKAVDDGTATEAQKQAVAALKNNNSSSTTNTNPSSGECTQSLAYCTQYGNEVGRYGYVYADGTVAGQYIAPDGTPHTIAVSATQKAAQQNAQVVANQLSGLSEQGLLTITGAKNTTEAIQQYLTNNAVIDPNLRGSITEGYLNLQKQNDFLNLTDAEIKKKYGDVPRASLIASLSVEDQQKLKDQLYNNLDRISKLEQFLNPTTSTKVYGNNLREYLKSIGITEEEAIDAYIAERNQNVSNYYNDLNLVNLYSDPTKSIYDISSAICKGDQTCISNLKLTNRDDYLKDINYKEFVATAKTNYQLQLINYTGMIGTSTFSSLPVSTQNDIRRTNTEITKALAAYVFDQAKTKTGIDTADLDAYALNFGKSIMEDPQVLKDWFSKYNANQAEIDNLIKATQFYNLTSNEQNPAIIATLNEAKRLATIPGLSSNGQTLAWNQVSELYRHEVRLAACSDSSKYDGLCGRYKNAVKSNPNQLDTLAAALDAKLAPNAEPYLKDLFNKLTGANIKLSTVFSNVATIDNPLVNPTLKTQALTQAVTTTNQVGPGWKGAGGGIATRDFSNANLTPEQIRLANEYLNRQLVTETYKIGGGAAVTVGVSLLGIGATALLSPLCGPGAPACFYTGLVLTGGASWGASQIPLYEMTAEQYQQQRATQFGGITRNNDFWGGILQGMYTNQGAWGDEGPGRSLTTRDNQFALYNAIQTKLNDTTLSSLMSDTTYGAQIGAQAYALNQSEVFQNRQEQWTWASLPISMATTTLFGGSGASAANQISATSVSSYIRGRLTIDVTQQLAGSTLNYAQARAQFDTTSGDISLLSTPTQIEYQTCIMTQGVDQCTDQLKALNDDVALNRSNAIKQAMISDALLGSVQTAAGYIGVRKQYNSLKMQAKQYGVDISTAKTVGKIQELVSLKQKELATLTPHPADVAALDPNTQKIIAAQNQQIAQTPVWSDKSILDPKRVAEYSQLSATDVNDRARQILHQWNQADGVNHFDNPDQVAKALLYAQAADELTRTSYQTHLIQVQKDNIPVVPVEINGKNTHRLAEAPDSATLATKQAVQSLNNLLDRFEQATNFSLSQTQAEIALTPAGVDLAVKGMTPGGGKTAVTTIIELAKAKRALYSGANANDALEALNNVLKDPTLRAFARENLGELYYVQDDGVIYRVNDKIDSFDPQTATPITKDQLIARLADESSNVSIFGTHNGFGWETQKGGWAKDLVDGKYGNIYVLADEGAKDALEHLSITDGRIKSVIQVKGGKDALTKYKSVKGIKPLSELIQTTLAKIKAGESIPLLKPDGGSNYTPQDPALHNQILTTLVEQTITANTKRENSLWNKITLRASSADPAIKTELNNILTQLKSANSIESYQTAEGQLHAFLTRINTSTDPLLLDLDSRYSLLSDIYNQLAKNKNDFGLSSTNEQHLALFEAKAETTKTLSLLGQQIALYDLGVDMLKAWGIDTGKIVSADKAPVNTNSSSSSLYAWYQRVVRAGGQVTYLDGTPDALVHLGLGGMQGNKVNLPTDKIRSVNNYQNESDFAKLYQTKTIDRDPQKMHVLILADQRLDFDTTTSNLRSINPNKEILIAQYRQGSDEFVIFKPDGTKQNFTKDQWVARYHAIASSNNPESGLVIIQGRDRALDISTDIDRLHIRFTTVSPRENIATTSILDSTTQSVFRDRVLTDRAYNKIVSELADPTKVADLNNALQFDLYFHESLGIKDVADVMPTLTARHAEHLNTLRLEATLGELGEMQKRAIEILSRHGGDLGLDSEASNFIKFVQDHSQEGERIAEIYRHEVSSRPLTSPDEIAAEIFARGKLEDARLRTLLKEAETKLKLNADQVNILKKQWGIDTPYLDNINDLNNILSQGVDHITPRDFSTPMYGPRDEVIYWAKNSTTNQASAPEYQVPKQAWIKKTAPSTSAPAPTTTTPTTPVTPHSPLTTFLTKTFNTIRSVATSSFTPIPTINGRPLNNLINQPRFDHLIIGTPTSFVLVFRSNNLLYVQPENSNEQIQIKTFDQLLPYLPTQNITYINLNEEKLSANSYQSPTSPAAFSRVDATNPALTLGQSLASAIIKSSSIQPTSTQSPSLSLETPPTAQQLEQFITAVWAYQQSLAPAVGGISPRTAFHGQISKEYSHSTLLANLALIADPNNANLYIAALLHELGNVAIYDVDTNTIKAREKQVYGGAEDMTIAIVEKIPLEVLQAMLPKNNPKLDPKTLNKDTIIAYIDRTNFMKYPSDKMDLELDLNLLALLDRTASLLYPGASSADDQSILHHPSVRLLLEMASNNIAPKINVIGTLNYLNTTIQLHEELTRLIDNNPKIQALIPNNTETNLTERLNNAQAHLKAIIDTVQTRARQLAINDLSQVSAADVLRLFESDVSASVPPTLNNSLLNLILPTASLLTELGMQAGHAFLPNLIDGITNWLSPLAPIIFDPSLQTRLAYNVNTLITNYHLIPHYTRQFGIGVLSLLQTLNFFPTPPAGNSIINIVEERSSTNFVRPTTIQSLVEYIENAPQGNESELAKETRLISNLQQSLQQEPLINNGVEPAEFLNPQDLIINSEIYRLKQLFADQTPYGKQLQRIYSKVRGSFFGVIGVKGGALYTRTQALVELHGKAAGYTFFNRYGQVDQVQQSTKIKDINQATAAVQFATLLTLKYQHTGLYADANDGVRYDRPNTVGAAERSVEIFGKAISQDREKVKELARPDLMTPELFALYTDDEFWDVVFDLAQKEIKQTTYNEFKSTLDPPSPNSINEALNLAVTTLYPGHQISANPRQNPALLYWFEQFWAQNSDIKLEPGFIANSLNNDITTFNRWYKLDEKSVKGSATKSSFIRTILNPNQVGDVASRDQILSDLFVSLMGHKTNIETAATFDTVLADLPSTYPDNTPHNAESFELSHRFINYLRDKANIPEPLFTLLEKLIIDPTHAQKIYFTPLWEKFFVDYYNQLSVEEKKQNPITTPQDYRAVFLKFNPHITPKDLEDAYNTGLLNSDAQPMISSFGINVAVKVLGHHVVLRLDAKGLSQANSVLSFQQIGGDILLRVVTDGVIKDIKIDTDKACPGCYLARGASVGDEYVLISPSPLTDDQLNNLQTILHNGKDEYYHGAKWLTVDSRTGQVKVEDAQIKQLDTKVAAEEVYGPDNALAPVPSLAQIRNLLERNYPNVIDIIKDLYGFSKNENPNIDQIMERVSSPSKYPTPYDRDLTLQLIVMTYTDYLVDQQLAKIVPTGNYPQIISTRNIETYQRMLYTLKPGQVLVFRRGIELYLSFPGNSGSINTLHIDVPGTFKQINDSEGYFEGDRLASHIVGIVLSQLKSQTGVLTQDQLRTISDQIHNQIDNTSYTTSKGVTYQLHAGTAVVHAKSPDRWVYNYMDSTRSQGNSDFIVHLQQDLKNGKDINTFLSTHYSDPKRGLSRLLQLTRNSSLSDAIYNLKDLDLFLPPLHKAILDYTPARQSRDLLSARLKEASQRGATNIYSNISTSLPGSEKIHKLFYIFSDPNRIKYSLDDQATVLDILPAGARIHFRVGLVDEETDSEYVKLDNGTWEAVEKDGWQVRFLTLFELATRVLVFAPDLGSGQAFFQQLTNNPDKIFIGFNAAARIKDGILSEPAVYGLSLAYTLIEDLLFELQKLDPTITIKDLACATIACNTISLFHERALALANLEEGSSMFVTALPLIKNLVSKNPDQYLVISTDGYQKEVIEKHNLPTYRSRIMGQSNPALFTKAMSIIQEIIWRQKALDKVFIPEEILNADPSNSNHIEYIANRYRLTTRVHDLIEELLKLEDQLGYPIRLILACTELPDAFKMAAKQDLYVKAYMERGGNLDTLDPQNFSPLDPALLVNAELLSRQYSHAFKTSIERLRDLFFNNSPTPDQPITEAPQFSPITPSNLGFTNLKAIDDSIEGIVEIGKFIAKLFGFHNIDTIILNTHSWGMTLKNIYINIFGDNEKLNAFANPAVWVKQTEKNVPTIRLSAPYPLLKSDPNLPPLPKELNTLLDHMTVLEYVTGIPAKEIAKKAGQFLIDITARFAPSDTPALAVLSEHGKAESIMGPAGQHRMAKYYARPTHNFDTLSQAEIALRAQLIYFTTLFNNLKDNQLHTDPVTYKVTTQNQPDRNVRFYFPQQNTQKEIHWFYFDLPVSQLNSLFANDKAITHLSQVLFGLETPDPTLVPTYTRIDSTANKPLAAPLGSITFTLADADGNLTPNEPYMLYDPNTESNIVAVFNPLVQHDINSALYLSSLRIFNSHSNHGVPEDQALNAVNVYTTQAKISTKPFIATSQISTEVRPLKVYNSFPENKYVEEKTNATYGKGLPKIELFKRMASLLAARTNIREVVTQISFDTAFQSLLKIVREQWKLTHPDSELSPTLFTTLPASQTFGTEGNTSPVNYIVAADIPNSMNIALAGGAVNNRLSRLIHGFETIQDSDELAHVVNSELAKINDFLLLQTKSRTLNYSTISRILVSINYFFDTVLYTSRQILGQISEATLSRVQLSNLGKGDNATVFETAGTDLTSHGLGLKGDILTHKNVGDPYIWAESGLDVFLKVKSESNLDRRAIIATFEKSLVNKKHHNEAAIKIVRHLLTLSHDEALLQYRHLIATSHTSSKLHRNLDDATTYLNNTLSLLINPRREKELDTNYSERLSDAYVKNTELLTLRFVANTYQTLLFTAQATLTNPDTATINLMSQLQRALDDIYAQMELLRPGSTPTSAPTPSQPNKEVSLTSPLSKAEAVFIEQMKTNPYLTPNPEKDHITFQSLSNFPDLTYTAANQEYIRYSEARVPLLTRPLLTSLTGNELDKPADSTLRYAHNHTQNYLGVPLTDNPIANAQAVINAILFGLWPPAGAKFPALEYYSNGQSEFFKSGYAILVNPQNTRPLVTVGDYASIVLPKDLIIVVPNEAVKQVILKVLRNKQYINQLRLRNQFLSTQIYTADELDQGIHP